MRMKLALASLASVFALVAMPASVFAGYTPVNRTTFQCITPTDCPGANYVTFNSFTNASNYGDERAFFDAKDASITSAGGYQDSLSVHNGQRIEMRVYVHNNANPAAIGDVAATAHNTQLLVLLPQGARTSQQSAAQISADNANPHYVSDTVDMSGSNPFTLAFDTSAPVMVTYRPNGTGSTVTDTLPGVTFSDAQTMTANMGDWRGCFNYAALITFTAVVNMPTPPTPPAPTPAKPAVASQAKALPNTGAGDVLGIFAGASAAGTAGHYLLARRRR